VLAVPVLVYVLGQDVAAATTASLVVVTGGALAGGAAHHRAGRVCWRHAAAFTVAAVPGIFAGTAAGDTVGGGALLAGFAVLMLAAAFATWRKSGAVRGAGDRAGDGAAHAACPPLRAARGALAGVLVGFTTGFFGVGGGFLIVPTLALALAFTLRAAVGTSLAIITATSLIAVGVHLLAGRTLDPAVTAAMTAAAVAGALAGARLAGRVPQRALGRAFAALVAAVAVYLIVAGAFLGGPPGS
ncbi:MAG TPA: sulfite exporter TauE/SafE family protein, partial [Solirubrobacteraceae bacterium]|nr:sulfite exporter TauE/SafE family protein [Solirubrobacteraceae bacterium]